MQRKKGGKSAPPKKNPSFSAEQGLAPNQTSGVLPSAYLNRDILSADVIYLENLISQFAI
jgi:hypothetical protein